MIYNADIAPDEKAWLSIDEDERIAMVEASHRPLPKNHGPTPDLRVHSTFHVIVENQIALDAPKPVRAVMKRLQGQGRGTNQFM